MKQKRISPLKGLKEKITHRIHKTAILVKREEAMGTLEIVVITGILLTIALLFNTQIREFAGKLFKSVFNDSKVISNILK